MSFVATPKGVLIDLVEGSDVLCRHYLVTVGGCDHDVYVIGFDRGADETRMEDPMYVVFRGWLYVSCAHGTGRGNDVPDADVIADAIDAYLARGQP